jgi:hypothetical protein
VKQCSYHICLSDSFSLSVCLSLYASFYYRAPWSHHVLPEVFLGLSTPGKDGDSGLGQGSGHLVLGRVDVTGGPVNLQSAWVLIPPVAAFLYICKCIFGGLKFGKLTRPGSHFLRISSNYPFLYTCQCILLRFSSNLELCKPTFKLKLLIEWI